MMLISVSDGVMTRQAVAQNQEVYLCEGYHRSIGLPRIFDRGYGGYFEQIASGGILLHLLFVLLVIFNCKLD
jgi:hypothetical protein